MAAEVDTVLLKRTFPALTRGPCCRYEGGGSRGYAIGDKHEHRGNEAYWSGCRFSINFDMLIFLTGK